MNATTESIELDTTPTADESADDPSSRLAELNDRFDDLRDRLSAVESRKAGPTEVVHRTDILLSKNGELRETERRERRQAIDAIAQADREAAELRNSLSEVGAERGAILSLQRPDRKAIAARLKRAEGTLRDREADLAPLRDQLAQITTARENLAECEDVLTKFRARAWETGSGNDEAEMLEQTRFRDAAALRAQEADAVEPIVLKRVAAAEIARDEASSLVERMESELASLDAADSRRTAAQSVADAVDQLHRAWDALRRLDPVAASSLRQAVGRGELLYRPDAKVASDRFARPEWLR